MDKISVCMPLAASGAVRCPGTEAEEVAHTMSEANRTACGGYAC